MAHPKHEEVRQRYHFRCGYCGVSEADSGGELTVDHYRPVVCGGDDSDDNLVYGCMRCNGYKHDFFPDPNSPIPEQRILHPLKDDLSLHLREEENGMLTGLSATGLFHIRKLRLNRPQLIEYRLIQRNKITQRERIVRLERMIGDVSAAVEELRELAQRLRQDIDGK